MGILEQAKVNQEVESDEYNEVVRSDGDTFEHCMLPKQDCECEAAGETLSVKTHLADSVTFWKEVIQAPPRILEMILSGYAMPLEFSGYAMPLVMPCLWNSLVMACLWLCHASESLVMP